MMGLVGHQFEYFRLAQTEEHNGGVPIFTKLEITKQSLVIYHGLIVEILPNKY